MADFEPSDELRQMQELSNKWEPEAEGPLVSGRLPTSAITAEYANADPTFQVKTATLPLKYAEYRTCRGDGHCGWRAVAFGYYEALAQLGDKARFLEEQTRLKALSSILSDVGFSEYLYEDFADDTVELLRTTANAQDGGAELLAFFNDINRSMSVITFLKLLTSAHIRTHPNDYQPFLDQPVDTYCKNSIEPAVCEIEHIGMCGLVDVLVKPAGIALEILYLDRSSGQEGNTYQFTPMDSAGDNVLNPPTIHLLYRPGHYDILYKAEDMQPQVVASNGQHDVFVALNHASTERYHPRMPHSFTEADIPGYSIYSGPEQYTWNAYAPAFDNYEQSCVVPALPATPTVVPPQSSLSMTTSYAAGSSTSTAASSNFYSNGYGMDHQTSHQTTLPSPTSPYHHPMLQDRGIFRPSQMQLQVPLDSPHMPMLQTTIFKNSHYNVAHFRNPEFMPEQWHPGADYIPSDRTRKKSSSHSS